MTWAPCRRIVRADVPPAFRVRGINAPLLLCWPNAALNSAADYSLDFAGMLCCGDRIVEAVFEASGNQIAWSSIFGTFATAWIVWLTSGPQTVTVTARTSDGQVFTVSVSVTVQSTASLIAPDLPLLPPNAITLGGVIFPDASGAPLVTG
ncbi:phage fiber-tail adaptor protein [Gluconobacter oxydans]|uniref:Uncharacterized protein n=1 Tax=Gluconobacter oxydans (strain 621H) TaxID=290633 RepID=Q5FN88_GLUOX|nr:hypothetical protein [Gluconobacter oxydans]AAW62159.1 Hypothetical protein GOX2428 [Gluconobacter oxydans 621H]